jgi:hypothetical protein
VTVGTLIFVVTATLSRVTNFESTKNFPLWQKAAHLLIMTDLLFALSWMVGLNAAAIDAQHAEARTVINGRVLIDTSRNFSWSPSEPDRQKWDAYTFGLRRSP